MGVLWYAFYNRFVSILYSKINKRLLDFPADDIRQSAKPGNISVDKARTETL